MENAFDWLEKNGGILTQAVLPYTSGNGDSGKCKKDTTNPRVQIKSHNFVSTDEKAIKEYLFANGPLAIALNAGTLQFYTGGIIDDDASTCDPSALDHGVTLVGYGTEKGLDYWIVKNSWGQWGENGYFRMSRGKGTCGLNTHVVDATLA